MDSKVKSLIKATAFCSVLFSQSLFADDVTVNFNPINITYDGSLQVGRVKGTINIANSSICRRTSPHGILDLYSGSKKISYSYPSDSMPRNTPIQIYSSSTDTEQYFVSCEGSHTIKTMEGNFEGDVNYFEDLCLSLGSGFHPSAGGLMAKVHLSGLFSSATEVGTMSLTGIAPLNFDLNCALPPPSLLPSKESSDKKPK